MSNLLLSLGHNSSAILVDNGQIVSGYEEERLTKIKSDSSFPIKSINQLKYHNPKVFDGITDVYISHWFIDGRLPEFHDKYFDPLYFEMNLPSVKVHSVSMDFTHHDAHAWSATLFAGEDFPRDNTLIMVADGFGNFGETMSLYMLDDHGEPKLFRRSFGYESSLGLMYQYATAFLELKENKDEYKLLGYEAHIQDYLIEEEIAKLTELAIKNSEEHLKIITSRDVVDKYDPLLALDALPALRFQYGMHYQKILDKLEIGPQYSMDAKRSVIAYYVQTRLELTVKSIIFNIMPKNIILVGGVFMNVKLNSAVSDAINGITCIMPLSGDQGATLGLYHAMERDLVWPDHLFWGDRELYYIDNSNIHFFMNNPPEYETFISDLLRQNYIVNVVKGKMEFGSRALGNTTTLALPTKENVDYINQLNGRSTIMPMAPIVAKFESELIFKNTYKIHESLKYMVCTRDFNYIESRFKGASHNLPNNSGYTGRPQVIESDHWLYSILITMPNSILINTSFNEHGMPICYSIQDVLRCHQYQRANDVDNRICTVIIN